MDATLKLKAEQFAGDIADQAQTLDDLNGLFRTLMKSALERMLDTEMDVHLGRKKIAAFPTVNGAAGDQAEPSNRRNGHSKKTLRGDLGELALENSVEELKPERRFSVRVIFHGCQFGNQILALVVT